MTAREGALTITDKFGIAIPAKHTHKPCGHTDRCNAPRGGCQSCARTRHIKEEMERNARNAK